NGALTARGKAALNFLRGAHETYREGAERASVGITNVLEAFQQARVDRAEKLESMLGEELLTVLSRKNSEASLQRALDNVLKALDPETDLANFFARNKQIAAAVQSGLRIPSSVKPTPNTVAEVRAVEAAVNDSAPVREAMAKTLGEELPIGE